VKARTIPVAIPPATRRQAAQISLWLCPRIIATISVRSWACNRIAPSPSCRSSVS
jgi:hypothetical protein